MADYSVGLSVALRSRAKETKWAIPVHSATGRVNFTSLTGRQYLLVQVGIPSNRIIQSTENVETFAQYIFSRISRKASDARKFDVNEK